MDTAVGIAAPFALRVRVATATAGLQVATDVSAVRPVERCDTVANGRVLHRWASGARTRAVAGRNANVGAAVTKQTCGLQLAVSSAAWRIGGIVVALLQHWIVSRLAISTFA